MTDQLGDPIATASLRADMSSVENPARRRVLAQALLLLLSCEAAASGLSARELALRSAHAQGGLDKLRSIWSLACKSQGYRTMLEQSERPEGPYFVESEELLEIFDWTNGALYYRREAYVPGTPVVAESITVVAGKAMVTNGARRSPGTREHVAVAEQRLALHSAHLLLTALDAPDLRTSDDAMLYGIRHYVLDFTLHESSVRIYLNAHTDLPRAIEVTGVLAEQGYAAYLGHPSLRIVYSMWTIQANGLHLPLQWDFELGGAPAGMRYFQDVRLNEPLPAGLMTMPRDVAVAYDSAPIAPRSTERRLDSSRARELAPGIVLLQGAWNVVLVLQQDGVLIIEAPISPGYSEQVVRDAQHRFPGKPVIGVISTSDAWPHVAGIATFAKLAVPIYALDLNLPVLRRMTSCWMPGVEPHLISLHDRFEVGGGPNRVWLLPVRGMTAERQLMIYFPEWKLLYGSDVFQRDTDGHYYVPQTVDELQQAVAREGLDVQSFFMMHMDATQWSDLPGNAPT